MLLQSLIHMNMKKLNFKCFLILLLCLSGLCAHAQSAESDLLKGKKWKLQLPRGKSYTSYLVFKDSVYTSNFCYNGQTYTLEKPYKVQQENGAPFYIIFPSEGYVPKTFSVKFRILKLTDKLLKLQNTTTNVVNTYLAK